MTKYMVVLYILLLALLWMFGWAVQIEREKYEISQDSLRTQIAISDSLQTLIDTCDSRVNDMRLQRDHAIEINNRHETRWNEMMRVRP